MNAGSIAVLEEPVDGPLESWSRNGGLPALDVRNTQQDLGGGSVVQSGVAGDRVPATKTDVAVADNGKVLLSNAEVAETVATEWVADVVGAGFVVAESITGSGDYPFPLGLFMSRVGVPVERTHVDLQAVADTWAGDSLHDTWMVSERDGPDAVSIDYHDHAHRGRAGDANIGLGFVLSWRGQVAKGVLYASGYLAIWESWTSATFCEFVDSEVLPHAYVLDDDDEPGEQATLGEGGGEEAGAE